MLNGGSATMTIMSQLETMTHLFVVLETILVLVGLLTTNDGAAEWLCLLSGEAEARHELLLAQTLGKLAVVGELVVVEPVLEASKAATLLAEQALGRLVDAQPGVIVVHVAIPKAKVVRLLHLTIEGR